MAAGLTNEQVLVMVQQAAEDLEKTAPTAVRWYPRVPPPTIGGSQRRPANGYLS
jgi:hypothetical protein